MTNRRDVQDAVKAAQARNSQNMQWIGQVVSADTTGGLCSVNVRGKILTCKVQERAQVIYDSFVLVSRIPGEAHLVVEAGNYTAVKPTVKPVPSFQQKQPSTINPDAPLELTATVELGSNLFMHNSKHVLRCLNYFVLTAPAVWEEITVTGFTYATDTICSLAIDPDGKGAWLVTLDATPAMSTTTGVFRCADITTGSFTLVYSQKTGVTDSIAAKEAAGFPTPSTGSFRSCISFGNGCVCVPEQVDAGIFYSLSPSAVHVYSGTWQTSVPSGAGLKFFVSQYFDTGSHQIDWDGASIHIAGTRARAGGGWNAEGCIASSSDGIAWTLQGYDWIDVQLYSCNVVAGTFYCYSRDSGCVIALPNTHYSPGESDYTFGFRRTQYGGSLVQILYSGVTRTNTQLYLGNVLQLTAGGAIATVTVVNGGTGGTYAPGDILTLTAPEGGASATVTVLTVTGDDVATVGLTTPGTAYSVGTYATTGGGGTGCTIGVATLTDGIPQFGAARVLGVGEFVLAARDAVAVGVVSVHIVNGVIHDRTGNLLTVIGGAGWEGTISANNNAMDTSGIEVIEGVTSTSGVFLEWSSTGWNTVEYYVFRSLTDDPDDFEWLATVPVEQTSYLDISVSVGVSYWYRVQAKSASSFSAFSNVVTVTV